jgi:hypothetical protein
MDRLHPHRPMTTDPNPSRQLIPDLHFDRSLTVAKAMIAVSLDPDGWHCLTPFGIERRYSPWHARGLGFESP